MPKLLSANLARLRAYKPFWVECAALFAFGIFIIVTRYQDYGRSVAIEDVFFGYTTMIGMVCAIFVSLFLGTEYSDGTYKNKIVIGHTKTAVYLSNVIIGVVAGLILNLAWILSMLSLGTILFGWFTLSAVSIFSRLAAILMMTVAYVAFFTLLCMLNSNKAGSAVVALLSFFALLFVGSYCNFRLEEPSMIDLNPYTVTFESDGAIIDYQPELVPNPNYLEGFEREIYEFVNDFLPTGQAIQLSQLIDLNLVRMILCSISILVLATLIGITFFRRKDLK
ncbi:MAG: ABC transporter permease [Lachnospiraceae bacterium]|jgi:hypothetical protein|nr:ABC transporter permease [Lachnospiraceae bacterium]